MSDTIPESSVSSPDLSDTSDPKLKRDRSFVQSHPRLVVGLVLVGLLCVAFYAASRPSNFVRLRAEVVPLAAGVSFVDVTLGENVYALEAKFLPQDELVEFEENFVSDPLPTAEPPPASTSPTAPEDLSEPSQSSTPQPTTPTTADGDLLPPTSPPAEVPLRDSVVDRTGSLTGSYLAAFEVAGLLTAPAEVRVVSVDPASPLFSELPPGTTIEAVARISPDGGVGLPPQTLTSAAQLVAAIRSSSPGDRVTLITDAGTFGAEISATPALGLTLEDYRVASSSLDPDLLPPAAVRPSAGLASGIAILDELEGGSLLADKKVVAVGMLALDGTVVSPTRLPLRLKAIDPSEFDLVFVPAGTELPDKWDSAENVILVGSLASAAQYLR